MLSGNRIIQSSQKQLFRNEVFEKCADCKSCEESEQKKKWSSRIFTRDFSPFIFRHLLTNKDVAPRFVRCSRKMVSNESLRYIDGLIRSASNYLGLMLISVEYSMFIKLNFPCKILHIRNFMCKQATKS